MKRPVVCLIGLCCFMSSLWSQQKAVDTSRVLEEVLVRAYENNRKLIDVAAPVTVFGKSEFARFNNSSILPALNSSPGVRMEERSPGSYRLNIRGSALRSPFGVRNVKVYYNNIPYTDPGGNTFLNQLGLASIGSMEIIKGPGSSLYGAGSGGVVLINNDLEQFKRGATAEYTGGSFGSHNLHVNVRGGASDKLHNSLHYQYQESEGYRDHTKMDRRVLTWDAVAKVGNKGILKAHFMQGNLYYQTPGALTASEFRDNPKAARPPAGAFPGAEAAHASISQKLFLAGFNYTLVWNDHWQNTATLYAAYSQLKNPTIRNYERRIEPHFGSRNTIQYKGRLSTAKLTLIGGLESQQGFSTSKVYTNTNGNPDSLLTDDEINTRQISVFTQATVEFPHDWILTLGASINLLRVEIQRLSRPASQQVKKYNNELAPRIALLKKITPVIAVYGSLSKGFSPPTTAELLPSTGIITTSLEAEKGWNTEAGLRGNLFRGRMYFDMNLFYFGLRNTIAQRRDLSGADYFVNAGSTHQKGFETYVSYLLTKAGHPFFNHAKAWVSYTWNNFHYKAFERVSEDTSDYSGKRLPGTPVNYTTAGLDISTNMGLYSNLTYFYSDPIPLNDANTDFASSYNLCTIRLGYRKPLRENISLDIFTAADNIFDAQYSLGNDINAFGGRYYNAAPGIHFSAGASIRFSW